MAQWAVIRDKITLLPHSGADSLEIGKVGQYQVVCRKGEYAEGQEVVFIPEKSVLPDHIAEPFRNYLKGPDKNRVGSVRLRGELSMGICLSLEDATKICGELPAGDLAEALGITKYEAPIPACLAGDLDRLEGLWSQHDVEQLAIYAGEFRDDEDVVVTEKLHGSQMIVNMDTDYRMTISSKGLIGRGLCLKESIHNTYWRAARNCDLERLMRRIVDTEQPRVGVQIFGEVLPVQGGNWTYGLDPNKPEIRVFDVRADGESINWYLPGLWVPILLVETWDNVRPMLPALCKGDECVSGRSLHIREGVVVRPLKHRRAADGTRLFVKVINPAYAKKETGEEIS